MLTLHYYVIDLSLVDTRFPAQSELKELGLTDRAGVSTRFPVSV